MVVHFSWSVISFCSKTKMVLHGYSIGAQRVKNACISFRNFCDEQNIEAWVFSLLKSPIWIAMILNFQINRINSTIKWNFKLRAMKIFLLWSRKCWVNVDAWDVFNKWNRSAPLWRTSLTPCSGWEFNTWKHFLVDELILRLAFNHVLSICLNLDFPVLWWFSWSSRFWKLVGQFLWWDGKELKIRDI